MAIQDDLPQLILLPLRDSYDPTLGNDVITTQFDAGMPRQRLASVGKPHELSVTFRHKAQHQDYLQAFWRLYRAKPFAMRLILDSTSLEWYECRFFGQPQPKPLGGQVFDFSVGLIVRPKPLNLDVDAAYVWAYEQTGGDISTFFNALEKLVNEDMPDTLGEIQP